jgi:hypothetical protein
LWNRVLGELIFVQQGKNFVLFWNLKINYHIYRPPLIPILSHMNPGYWNLSILSCVPICMETVDKTMYDLTHVKLRVRWIITGINDMQQDAAIQYYCDVFALCRTPPPPPAVM